MLAKAYSIIRDAQGKDLSPLDKFLAINVPFINLVAPDLYLQVLGWSITGFRRDDLSLSRVDTNVDEAILTTTYSVRDIIKNSCDVGYIQRDMMKNIPDDIMMASACDGLGKLVRRPTNKDC